MKEQKPLGFPSIAGHRERSLSHKAVIPHVRMDIRAIRETWMESALLPLKYDIHKGPKTALPRLPRRFPSQLNHES